MKSKTGFQIIEYIEVMKGIGCRNVEKYVHNHNREVKKILDGQPDSQLRIQHILGTNNEHIKGQTVFTLSSEQVLYYSSEYFLAHNLNTKETSVIERKGCFHHQILFINRFRTENKQTLILTIQKHNQHFYVGQLQIRDSLTQIGKSAEEQPYSWKCSKLTNKHQFKIEDVSYHSQKHYLYILTSLTSEQKTDKYIWVYDLRRQCMIMSPLIKPSLSKSIISNIMVTDSPNEVFLMGKNYFRLWTIIINEKIIKESNYRNIERAIVNHTILKVLELHFSGVKYLAVLTESTLLLINKNELVSVLSPPLKSLQEIKNKDNIQAELENSLNQIYRMKFLYDQDENVKSDLTETQGNLLQQYEQFRCSSDVWQGQQGQSIVVATSSGNLITYCLAGGQMKLINHLVVRKKYQFDTIAASKKGELLVLSEHHCKNLYIVNKYSLNSEDKQEELKQFWGQGQVSNQNITSLSSPAVHERVCTLSQGNSFKIWTFTDRERRILFETKLNQKVSEATLHPCGLLVALNYSKEIKLMSILPTGIYEVMTAKTNYSSVGLQYSACGNYLVSNEQNLLIFYNPFTLKTLGYIEPPELKSKIVKFHITPEGNHIAFLTSDHTVYIEPLQLYNYSKYDTMIPAHTQKQPYTCFHFDGNISNTLNNKQGEPQNLFIGCTRNKYMALYKNFGKDLIMEYPVEDCYIVSLCVADGWLFAATSLNSIRVYKWPIREQDCQLEVLNLEHKMVRLKHPQYQEYHFWNEDKPITKMHLLTFSNKLIIAREGGTMTVFKYNKFYPQKFQQIGERKKLTQNLNSTFFITKNESEKRNRMIEKAESDIMKIENEIAKQKIILERKYNEQTEQHNKNFQDKINLQVNEKEDYLTKMKQNNQRMKQQVKIKRLLFEEKKHRTHNLYKKKEQFQDERNQQIRDDIKNIQIEHKKKIENKIRQHKQDIRNIKESFRLKVSDMKNEFENMVSNQYPSLLSLKDVETPKLARTKSRRCSLRLQKQKSSNFALQHTLNDEQIIQLNEKVDMISRSNQQLQNQLEQYKIRVRGAEYEDECLQKDFQTYLQQYNSNRFTNLSLHSEVLKMRTQLLERREIMEHKQDIINLAYQERQKLQNYKELVKGSLTKIHDKKQNIQNRCSQKQNEVALIFAELNSNLNEYEDMKTKEKNLAGLLNVYKKDKDKQQQKIDKAITRLKQLKRYLLLQGLTEDQEQKQLYVEQQNLLTNINFYKKRMTMEAIKEKKNKGLKKSSLNLVLKQNKNLLEEVNHLRQQTFGRQHEITNLGKKLGEANRMISIECKLKGQKTEVNEQRNQLEAIRALFSHEMTSCKEVEQEDEIKPFDLD